MAENQFHPSSPASTAFPRMLPPPSDATTPSSSSSSARTGKSQSKPISTTASFLPIRVSHGVFMRPVDVPKYKITRNYSSVDPMQKTQSSEIGPDLGLEKLLDDIDYYVSLQQPQRVIGRVRGGVFKKPKDVVHVRDVSETDGMKKGEIQAISQPYQVTSKISSDSQPQLFRKPTHDNVVVACNENSEKLDPGGNQLAGQIDSCVADVESRYEKPPMKKMSRASNSEFKAQGNSLKRPSEDYVVLDCNPEISFHGGEKTCQNAVRTSDSGKKPRISTPVRKYRRLSDLEFPATEQRGGDGTSVARPVETTRDMGNSEKIPMDETKVRSMKHGTLLKPSNSRRLSLWDKLKHRSCQRTAINCSTSSKVEETRSLAVEKRNFTCHSSTDGNRAECSRTKLVGGDQSFIRERSSSASNENLPTLNLDKVTQKSQDSDEIGDRNRVKDILLRFRALCRELSTDGVRRVDCEAANQLKRNRDIPIPQKLIGHIPGINVGDEFLYRMEISVIGLHKPPQAGIDFIRHGTYEICTSIVASGCGGYDNDINNTEYLIYSGHGGTCSRGRKDPVDQELQRGNLALKNSVSIKNAVRVIRGNKEVGEGGKIKSIYIYDGLYQVETFWKEQAAYGKMVYKFKLVRMPGQCKLSKNQWVKLGRH